MKMRKKENSDHYASKNNYMVDSKLMGFLG